MADYATPDPTTQSVPEPLLSAEAVRVLLLAAGAGGWGLPMPFLIQVGLTVVTLVGSFALTMIARGKVWAMRRGVDVDQVVDEAQRRTSVVSAPATYSGADQLG